jgi:hypothetical protein
MFLRAIGQTEVLNIRQLEDFDCFLSRHGSQVTKRGVYKLQTICYTVGSRGI